MMQLEIICGSPRPDAESARVSHGLAAMAAHYFDDLQAHVVDLSEVELPLYLSPAMERPPSAPDEALGALRQRIWQADAFVLVSPEWNGMANPALKNLLNYFCDLSMAHKPAMLVAVSAGIGGSYPIAEMRMNSYKNTYLCFTPDHLIVTAVAEHFQHDEYRGDTRLTGLERRALHSLGVLETYAAALKPVRAGLCEMQAEYPYGM